MTLPKGYSPNNKSNTSSGGNTGSSGAGSSRMQDPQEQVETKLNV